MIKQLTVLKTQYKPLTYGEYIVIFKIYYVNDFGTLEHIKHKVVESLTDQQHACSETRLAILQQPYHMTVDKQFCLSSVTRDMLLGFVNQFLSRMFAECYFHGNYLAQVNTEPGLIFFYK